MSTVTVFTAERMQAIEDGTVTSGEVVGDNLILTKHDGTEVNAGNVRGAAGPTHTFPGCTLQSTSDQGSTDGAWWNVSWGGSDLRDTDGFHTPGSDVITAQFEGWYHLCGSLVWEPNVTGPRLVRYTINGSGDNRLAQGSSAGMGTRGVRLSFAKDIYLELGQLLRISGLQESGGALALASGCDVSLRFLSSS